MRQSQKQLALRTRGQGLYEFTREVLSVVAGSGVETGLCTVFVQFNIGEADESRRLAS